jgi:translation initiation factor IF-3
VLPFLVGASGVGRRNNGGTPIKEPRVNEKIRVKEVRLVDPDGGQIGIKSIEEARWLANQLELDLVEVAPDARPPVVRLMDYGKFKYDQSVKAREARKKQTRTVIKEVQFRPKIGASDFEVKRKRVERFLMENDKVKVTMRFRGREVTHPEIGHEILDRLQKSVADYGTIETPPRLEGRQMTMVLAPARGSSRSGTRKDFEQAAEVEAVPDDEAVAEGATDAEAAEE